MQAIVRIILLLLILPLLPVGAQESHAEKEEADNDWDRTRRIMNCAPRLVDRRDLVEDQFDHRYITNNPRDIEVGYFSVEPITYLDAGKRFCEALLPAAGVSHSYFRGCYATTYELPGSGIYDLEFISSALIFNNGIRMINAQNALGEVEALHRIEIVLDTVLNPPSPYEYTFNSKEAYSWELEIDESGNWNGELVPGDFKLTDTEIPAGQSRLSLRRRVRGPGIVTVRESVIFRVEAISAYRYDPIFQVACLFSLDPLGISTRLLPCEE
jgi:hypothetical protein